MKIQYIKTPDKIRIEPELWVHVRLLHSQKISRRLKMTWKRTIKSRTKELMSGKFGVKVDVIVIIEEGSVWVKVKIRSKSVAAILATYVLIHHSAAFFKEDITWAWKHVEPIIEMQIARTREIKDIEAQQRQSAIERLDELLQLYQEGKKTHSEAMTEVVRILEEINASPEKDTLVRALVRYINAKYENFPWERLLTKLKAINAQGTARTTPDQARELDEGKEAVIPERMREERDEEGKKQPGKRKRKERKS